MVTKHVVIPPLWTSIVLLPCLLFLDVSPGPHYLDPTIQLEISVPPVASVLFRQIEIPE